MNIFKRWGLRRQIKKEQQRIDYLRKHMPHAGFVEITRHNGNIRRLANELAGIQSNTRKETTT